MLPFALLCGLALWLCFGLLRVPAGMDTTPAVPPGSTCVIDKRSGAAQVGSLVFVDVPGGGTVLSRVREVAADGGLLLRHDNLESRLPDSRALGALPRTALRGTVLTVFVPDTTSELPGGK